MAQPSVALFFNTRKRAAAEDANSVKNRRLTEPARPTSQNSPIPPCESAPQKPLQQNYDVTNLKADLRTRSGRIVKRIGVTDNEVLPKKQCKVEKCDTQQQPKLVKFILKGSLTPRKKTLVNSVGNTQQKINEHTPVATVDVSKAFTSKANATNVERGLRTPTKQIIKGSNAIKNVNLNNLVKKELSFDEVKTKISRGAKMQELKASLSRINELEKTRKVQEQRNQRLKESSTSSPNKASGIQLKQFDTIELEVLTSPAKVLKTPTKLPPSTPDKNELMSPRHTDTTKRLLFSPAKNGFPSKLATLPAYQRFMSLGEKCNAAQLQLPFKYRYLLEIFKGLDSVCAMFHNRKECITFKKLKPAVQRMLRKNFTETHLSQIKHIFPEAFIFTQMKMRNYGSASKTDYFQLVISPNVDNVPETNKMRMLQIDEDNVMASAQSSSMNPHVMTERMQRFQYLLLQRVKQEHEKFLLSLDPPLKIDKEKVTRWHADFDLENCPDIELALLPQPPNVEKYSSAKDILSTARNLFNCATPMERVMVRYEAKIKADRVSSENQKNCELGISKQQTRCTNLEINNELEESKSNTTLPTCTVSNDCNASLLKGVPKSLLEKIRAKQAAKALDAITRRPSQDQEAAKYSRLPELARHLRNVFITERKGVLTLEIVIKKIQNSFRTSMLPQEIESHLRLLAKEVPVWIVFHEVRKTTYLKICKDMDMNIIIDKLETIANEKNK